MTIPSAGARTGVPTGLWQNYSTSSLNNCEIYSDIPSEFCHAPGWSNISTNDGTLFDIFQRDSYAADVSFFPIAAGDHRIKLGVQFENYENNVLDGYQNSRILYYWGRSYTTTTGERSRKRASARRHARAIWPNPYPPTP